MDKYEVGDVVRLKKQHPCGSSEWEILRVGADFRLKCVGRGDHYDRKKACREEYERDPQKRNGLRYVNCE